MMTTISPLTRELDNQGTVRIGNEDVGEPGLVSWKDCWDSLLNDSRFRSFYIGGNVYEYVMPVNFAPSPEDGFLRKFDGIDISGFVKKNPTYVSYQKRRLRKFDTSKLKGSILIKGGGEEDHYVSFRIKGAVLKIFDPADTSGRYDSYFPVRYRKILSIITGKRVVLSERHPQCTPGDTFCQTWTVARLNSSLKQYTKYTPRKSSPIATRLKSSVPHMYNIVHAIAHSPKFLEYLSKPDVHAKFNKIFKKSRMYYKLPIPKDLTAYFIALSRKIKPRHIESIFRGD
jgi:hypothetical protein